MCDDEKIFGKRVREFRLAAGMTQPQLGEAVGLKKQTINDIEHGRAKTTISRAVAIAQQFGTTVEHLTGRVQTPDSMVIEELAYNDGVLFVHFRNNDWYSYSNVPKDVYENFSAAQSKGQFFLKNIMPEYPCSICEAPPFQQISP